MKKKISITSLLIWIVAAWLVGAFSALFSGGFTQYASAVKPPLSPPPQVFGVVWAILYALMGASAYLIYISGSENKSKALKLYSAQLALNFSWSIIYFGLDMKIFAVFILSALITVLVLMLREFYRIKPLACFMNIPYLIWCLFALYLNIAAVIIG